MPAPRPLSAEAGTRAAARSTKSRIATFLLRPALRSLAERTQSNLSGVICKSRTHHHLRLKSHRTARRAMKTGLIMETMSHERT